MDKLGDLYPAFQNALMDNGNLVGWYVDAQPWGGKFFPLICWKNWHFPHQQPLMSC